MLIQRALNRAKDVLFIGSLFDVMWASRLNGKAICLCYHRVDDPSHHAFLTRGGVPVITPQALEDDILFLKSRGFKFITFEDQRKGGSLDPARPHVILSFDDGYKDNYIQGLEVLKKAGVPAVFFQTTAMVDAAELLWEHAIFWHCRDEENQRRFTELARRVLPGDLQIATKQGRELVHYLVESLAFGRAQEILSAARVFFGPGQERSLAAQIYPTCQEVMSAVNAGHEIASHGHLHYKRSGVSAEAFERDLSLSVDKLSSWTGKPPLTYAYPHGSSVRGDAGICAKYFRHVAMVRHGVIGPKSDPLDLPRFYWSGPPKNAVRRKRWLLTGVS